MKKTALKLIGEERSRQLAVEGFSFAHDDKHTDNQLANAAACYALDSRHSEREIWDKPLLDYLWPWEPEWFKPEQSRIRNLVKAGALICAEIERLQRLEDSGPPRPEPAGKWRRLKAGDVLQLGDEFSATENMPKLQDDFGSGFCQVPPSGRIGAGTILDEDLVAKFVWRRKVEPTNSQTVDQTRSAE